MCKSSTIAALLIYCQSVLAYRAAVLEYYPLISDTPKSTIFWNLNEYRRFAARAKADNADIIVFPEYGLTSLVNNTRRFAVEADEYSDVVTRLKDIASEFRIYLVVNFLERFQDNKERCCETPKIFNTNLVFDRDGHQIARYRKINLYHEDGIVSNYKCETASFTTDFGVTFGLFNSYDILFACPSQSILESGEVTDIVYPTAWYSTLPFYISLSIQHGYSISTGVNLLASSYNQPSMYGYMAGGGIYLHSTHSVRSNVSAFPTTKLLVLDIPESTRDSTRCVETVPPPPVFSPISDDFVPNKALSTSIYKFGGISGSTNSSKICYNDFCCFFDIVFGTRGNGTFKLAAFRGLDFYDQTKTNISICSLLVCENESVDSCGGKTVTNSTFERITVRTSLDGVFYMPLTVSYHLQPLGNLRFCNNDSGWVSLSTMEEEEGVLVFGLLGRVSRATGKGVYGPVVCVVLGLVYFQKVVN